MLELFIGYLLGKGAASNNQYKDEKTKEKEENMASIGSWESYNQDSRSLDELLAQAEENARGKQNN